MAFPDPPRDPTASLPAGRSGACSIGTDAAAILDALGDAVVVTDAALRPVYRNSAARAAFASESALPHWFDENDNAVAAADLPHAQTARTGHPSERVLAFGPDLDRARWFRVSAHVLSGTSALTRCVVSRFADVTELKRSELALRGLVNVDALTGLPNRRALHEQLERTISAARRRSRRIALAYLDLDGFKPVNDLYGHDAGDALLVQVAERIGGELRAGDLVARLGGDEFCIMLSEVEGGVAVGQVLQRVLAAINQPVPIGEGRSATVSASIGVAMFPADGEEIPALLRTADRAMYLAKSRGKNCVEFYDRDVDRQVEELRDLLTAIARGLDRNEFRLWFQPKVNLSTGRVVGLEALVRWQHPELGTLSPARFLPAIERSDLIVRLGDWVIGEALRCAARWHAEGLDLPVSVNVAARQIAHKDFFHLLEQHLSAHPLLPANMLQLELLETGTQQDTAALRVLLERCRELGVRCALDDFGTGPSSLTYFRYLPADTVKVDKTCVDAMLDNCDEYMLVRGIIAVADAFGMEVVAEGMETPEHGSRLFAAGCHIVQGYGIAAPMPESHVTAWCKRFRPDPRWTQSPPPFSDLPPKTALQRTAH